MQDKGNAPTHVWGAAVPTSHQTGIEEWLNISHVDIPSSIAPFAMGALLRDQVRNVDVGPSILTTSLKNALVSLTVNGCREDEQTARSALLSIEQHTHGIGRQEFGYG